MFVGACAGSTGGGIKVSRLLILCKSARKELQLYLHPNAVKKIKMDDKAIPHEIVRATNMFLFVYIMIFVTSLLIISLDNLDMVSNFTAITATLNNIGPGLGAVGPTGNFDTYSYVSGALDGVYGLKITNHEQVAENVYKTTFANGTSIYVNYNDSDYVANGIKIAAQDYFKVKGDKE